MFNPNKGQRPPFQFRPPVTGRRPLFASVSSSAATRNLNLSLGDDEPMQSQLSGSQGADTAVAIDNKMEEVKKEEEEKDLHMERFNKVLSDLWTEAVDSYQEHMPARPVATRVSQFRF